MRLDRYSAIHFAGVPLVDLATQLTEWIVPADSMARERRRKQGMRAEWTALTLIGTEDLIGSNGCAVKSRLAADGHTYLLRFTHRDDDPRVAWTTVFRLTTKDDDTILESAVAREAPPGVLLEPKARAPRVVIDLLRTKAEAVRPPEMVHPAFNAATKADVNRLVHQMLLSPARSVPLVVVARDVYGSGSAVDVSIVENHLRGIAMLATLDGTTATAAFEASLRNTGYGSDFRCFNGAIATYAPVATLANAHRLWLRRSIETLPETGRSAYVGETLARHLSLDRSSPGFLYAIEDFDRADRKRTSASIQALPELRDKLQRAEDDFIAESDKRRELEQQLDEVKLDLETERMYRASLQEQLETRRGAIALASLPDALRDGLAKIVRKTSPTPRQALDILQALFPERLVVLEDAIASAERDGPRFRKPAEVFDLLTRLCTVYYDALINGGDAQARRVFTPSEYAAQGSEGEMNSPACVRDRTRTFKGKSIVMWAHLRAGGKGAAEDCLRIHFWWAQSDQKIVVGHCGAHLAEA